MQRRVLGVEANLWPGPRQLHLPWKTIPGCHSRSQACGYADANDHDDLHRDPAFKLACGRLPESGDDLASQPTISRWENAPALRTLLRLGYAMIDGSVSRCASCW